MHTKDHIHTFTEQFLLVYVTAVQLAAKWRQWFWAPMCIFWEEKDVINSAHCTKCSIVTTTLITARHNVSVIMKVSLFCVACPKLWWLIREQKSLLHKMQAKINKHLTTLTNLKLHKTIQANKYEWNLSESLFFTWRQPLDVDGGAAAVGHGVLVDGTHTCWRLQPHTGNIQSHYQVARTEVHEKVINQVGISHGVKLHLNSFWTVDSTPNRCKPDYWLRIVWASGWTSLVSMVF